MRFTAMFPYAKIPFFLADPIKKRPPKRAAVRKKPFLRI
jgi:hypothetical protein